MPPPASDLPPAPPANKLANSNVRPRPRALPPPPPLVVPVTPLEFASPPPAAAPVVNPTPPSPISAALLPLLQGATLSPPGAPAMPVSQAMLQDLVRRTVPEAPSPAPMPFAAPPPLAGPASPPQAAAGLQAPPPIAPAPAQVSPPPAQPIQPPLPASVQMAPVQMSPLHMQPPPAVSMSAAAQPTPQPKTPEHPAPQRPSAAPAANGNGGEPSLDPDVMVAALKEAAARQDALQASPIPARAPEPEKNGADALLQPEGKLQAPHASDRDSDQADPPSEAAAVAPANGQRRARLGRRAAKKAPDPPRQAPDFSGLPPAMAKSLARLAGVPWPPQKAAPGQDERELEKEAAGSAKKGRNG